MLKLDDKYFMQKAKDLAKLGGENVKPNPQVGAVIVKNNKIIGQGYHQKYGGDHAEIVAIKSVKNYQNLEGATLYVSLEPCCHYGKTPPCTDAIIKAKFARVVIAEIDKNPKVNGNGIQILKNNGIEVCLLD